MGAGRLLLIVFVILVSGQVLSAETCALTLLDSTDKQLLNVEPRLEETQGATLVGEDVQRPNPLRFRWKRNAQKNRRITAAILAFPFPFGIVGVHRIYLGTKPYVPVAYIASLGGVFGILPFIDFCVILGSKDVDRFINNGKVFMWVK